MGSQLDIDDLVCSYETARNELAAIRLNAARYCWLRDNPRWIVSYRIKPSGIIKEWRMRDDGDYWGSWWPTHEQAIDHVMALNPAVPAVW